MGVRTQRIWSTGIGVCGRSTSFSPARRRVAGRSRLVQVVRTTSRLVAGRWASQPRSTTVRYTSVPTSLAVGSFPRASLGAVAARRTG